MRRWALLAVVVSAALAVAIAVARVPANTSVALPAKAGNRVLARREAHRILAALRLPPGASVAVFDPSEPKLLAAAPQRSAAPNLVDLHAFWRVPGDPRQVLAWIEAHPPAGSRSGMSGASSSGPGRSGPVTISTAWDGFGFGVIPGVFGYREVIVTVAHASGAYTALRADAQVEWLARRTASERIPARVDAIEISDRRVQGSSPGPWKVIERSLVRRIVALVNALPLGPAGPFACPNDVGPYVALTFSSAGHTVARVIADGSGCGFVHLSIGRRDEPFLAGGAGLVKRLSSLLGFSF